MNFLGGAVSNFGAGIGIRAGNAPLRGGNVNFRRGNQNLGGKIGILGWKSPFKGQEIEISMGKNQNLGVEIKG